jgi:hypothetical protein
MYLVFGGVKRDVHLLILAIGMLVKLDRECASHCVLGDLSDIMRYRQILPTANHLHFILF